MTKPGVARDQWDLLYEAAELFGAWKSVMIAFKPGMPTTELWAFILQGQALDRRLHQWSSSLTAEWGYYRQVFNVHSAPRWLWPLLEGDWVPRWLQKHDSVLTEIKWRDWLMVRMILNQALLRSAQELGPPGFSIISGAHEIRRGEIEHTLLNVIDEVFESCLAMLVRPLRSPEPQKVEDVCSLQGFVIIAPLASAYLCLSQAPFSFVDIRGRLDWARKALKFLQTSLGYAKAGAYLDESRLQPVGVQFWSLSEED